jgi:hypothetical protein
VADVDWETVAKASTHPLRLRIIEAAASGPEGRFSPVELAREFDEPLGNVAYHVRTLVGDGLLAKAGTSPRRGAVQHYYRASARLLRASQRP